MSWLRNFFRRHTSPIAEERAEFWKRRISFAYAFLAWNAFGIICYQMYKGKADWASYHGLETQEGTPAQQWAKTLNIKNATVYRISGTSVTQYDIKEDAAESTTTSRAQPELADDE